MKRFFVFKNVYYYKLTRSGYPEYDCTLADASHFSSVREALSMLQNSVVRVGNFLSDNVTLIQVDVIEGTPRETRRILTDCEGCRDGETVFYVNHDRGDGGYWQKPCRRVVSLEDATLFDTISDAYGQKEQTIARVAVGFVPSEPTYKETVLGA